MTPQQRFTRLPRSDGSDDRRLCADCVHFKAPVCRIAKPGGVVSAKYGYQPAEAGLLRRCIASALAGDDEEVKRLWNDWIQEQAQPARQAVGLGLKIKESICSALPSKPL